MRPSNWPRGRLPVMTPNRFAKLQRLNRAFQQADDRQDLDNAVNVLFEAIPELLAELERFFDPMARPAVAIESPFAGNVVQNTRYARLALLDSITRGEAPYAGHLLYTQVLADSSPTERELGIRSHLTYVRRSERVAVYEDLGISSGMQRAIDLVGELGIPVEMRRIG